MDRNTKTTAGNLKTGDRFYKVADRNKTVLQIIEHDPKVTHFRTYKIFCCSAQILDGNLSESVKAGYHTPILKDTEVVFLRNVNEGVAA